MAEPAATAPTVPAKAPLCRLLEKLSAELRNEIYELVFIPDGGYGQPVDFVAGVEPPDKTFLLTCRQVYVEAKGYYLDSFRRYWRESIFDANLHKYEDEKFRTALSAMAPADLDNIQKFSVDGEAWWNGEIRYYHYILLDSKFLCRHGGANSQPRLEHSLEWSFINNEKALIRVAAGPSQDSERPVPMSLKLGQISRCIEKDDLPCPNWSNVLRVHELPIKIKPDEDF